MKDLQDKLCQKYRIQEFRLFRSYHKRYSLVYFVVTRYFLSSQRYQKKDYCFNNQQQKYEVDQYILKSYYFQDLPRV